ncbi:MAG: tetratricopeptide repeat protein, partial [Thermodesulfobacteriota bacterium]
YNYFITQFGVILVYIGLFFFPRGLHLIYHYKPAMAFDGGVALSLIILLVILAATIYIFIRSYRKKSFSGLLLSAGLIWFFISLTVESSVIPIQHVIFEHRTYLPGVGFFIFLGVLLVTFSERLGKAMWVAIAIVLIILSALTYSRNSQWGDEIKFHLREVRESPHIATHHNDLGHSYMKRGMDAEAIAELTKALEIESDFVAPLTTLGAIYLNQKQYTKAMGYLQKAITHEPEYVEAHYNIGTIYLNTGRSAEAIVVFKKVLTLLYMDPLSKRTVTSDAHVNLANALYRVGSVNEAIEEYKNALLVNPENSFARQNLETVLKRTGKNR